MENNVPQPYTNEIYSYLLVNILRCLTNEQL